MGLDTADLVAAKGKKEISAVCADPYKDTITTKEVHQVGSISPYAENLKNTNNQDLYNIPWNTLVS